MEKDTPHWLCLARELYTLSQAFSSQGTLKEAKNHKPGAFLCVVALKIYENLESLVVLPIPRKKLADNSRQLFTLIQSA
jgi:hypothetical protein